MIENQNMVRAGITVVREGEEFTVVDVGPDIQTKAPRDANWQHAVIYRSLSAGETIRRVRPLVDFCQKFSIPEPEVNEEEDD